MIIILIKKDAERTIEYTPLRDENGKTIKFKTIKAAEKRAKKEGETACVILLA